MSKLKGYLDLVDESVREEQLSRLNNWSKPAVDLTVLRNIKTGGVLGEPVEVTDYQIRQVTELGRLYIYDPGSGQDEDADLRIVEPDDGGGAPQTGRWIMVADISAYQSGVPSKEQIVMPSASAVVDTVPREANVHGAEWICTIEKVTVNGFKTVQILACWDDTSGVQELQTPTASIGDASSITLSVTADVDNIYLNCSNGDASYSARIRIRRIMI